MARIKSGNLSPVTTRYQVDVGNIVEVMDEDEVHSCFITKVKYKKSCCQPVSDRTYGSSYSFY